MCHTVIFFLLLARDCLAYKGDDWTGGKRSKEKVSVLVLTNLIGTERCLLVIEKVAKPRCFKGMKTLPMNYASSRKAGNFRDFLGMDSKARQTIFSIKTARQGSLPFLTRHNFGRLHDLGQGVFLDLVSEFTILCSFSFLFPSLDHFNLPPCGLTFSSLCTKQ